MCIRKGKHGRAESQRLMCDDLMLSQSFSGLKDFERPALEPFGDKVTNSYGFQEWMGD